MNDRLCIALPWAAAALVACGSSEKPASTEPNDPWGNAALSRASDLDSDPRIVEVSLEAREGKKRYAGAPLTPVWTYNGTVPGPLIEGNVGDELLVHFKNSLPEETTIHWHGVRVPAAMDGTAAMQAPVPPGGTFEYRFELKDAGLFWFHPHVRSDTQVRKGLYGVIRVRSPEDIVADHEGILVLDDVQVLPDGTLPTYLDDDSKMLGRQGNILLVNGQSMPTLRWRAGATERLRVVNTANGRFFNLALPGYTWRVIGTDGGFIPQPYDTDHLLVSPGERYDVMLIVKGSPGTEATLMNDPYDRGHDTGKEPPAPVAKFVVTSEPPLAGRTLPDAFPALERIEDGAPDSTIALDEGIQGENLVFTINGATFPNVPPIQVPDGAVRRFEVQNKSEMDHPLHIHGTFFQILNRNGVPVPAAALANKDTVIVPQKSTLELAARFDEPGRWMYHCHVFEHAEGGMMGELDVAEPP